MSETQQPQSDVEWLREFCDSSDALFKGDGPIPVYDTFRLRAIADRLENSATLEALAAYIEQSGRPGPGGVDIASGIPSEVYVGIGRDHYDDEYDVAAHTAESVRNGLAALLRLPDALALIAATPAIPKH